MALVRISRDLLNLVDKQIDQVCLAQTNQIVRPKTEDKDFGASHQVAAKALADRLFWGDSMDIYQMILARHPAWLSSYKRLDVSTKYLHKDGTAETTAGVSVLVQGHLPPNMRANTYYGASDVFGLNVPYADIEAACADPTHPEHWIAAAVMAVVSYERELRLIRSDWKTKLVEIKDFLRRCKSLNEAVKLWPGVRLYIPKETLGTLDTPVVRPQAQIRKESALANVNTDGLTAAAVAARLAGIL